MSTLLIAVCCAPALGGAASWALSRRGAGHDARVLATALLAALAGSAIIAAQVISGAAIDAGILAADRLTAVLLLLVTGVTLVIASYADRYLRGDLRRPHLLLMTGVLASATLAMVSAASFIGLAIAWTVAGAALCSLLGTYRGHPAADEGVRRTRLAFLIADVALWTAVVIATAQWGAIDLRTLGERAPELAGDGTTITIVALLLVVAAIGRSALLPLHGWLPATLAAPTPVSALLHAGVINAGGVLLVTMSPIFGASLAATSLAFAAGAATAVYATSVMLTKTDIKGALAYSTAGQMGFMVMTCGLGLYAAAIFHLVAHGMYKASLFLGSGGALDRARRTEETGPSPELTATQRAATATVAAAVPGALVILAALVVYGSAEAMQGSAPLLAFAWISGSAATWGWLQRGAGPARLAVTTALLAVLAFGYVAGTNGLAELLAPALAGAGEETVPGIWIIAPILAMVALTATFNMPRAGLMRARQYSLLLGAGHIGPRLLRGATRPPGRRVSVAPTTATIGARS